MRDFEDGDDAGGAIGVGAANRDDVCAGLEFLGDIEIAAGLPIGIFSDLTAIDIDEGRVVGRDGKLRLGDLAGDIEGLAEIADFAIGGFGAVVIVPDPFRQIGAERGGEEEKRNEERKPNQFLAIICHFIKSLTGNTGYLFKILGQKKKRQEDWEGGPEPGIQCKFKREKE